MSTSRRLIEVQYKCACMLKDATFHMVERGVAEDIDDFMLRARQAMSDDHMQRSPFCNADRVEYIKLPIVEDVVGGGKGGTA